MRWEQVEFKGFKNLPPMAIPLTGLTIIGGDNASGKSAVLEAIRLAVSGSCSLGSSGPKVGLVLSGDAASRLSNEGNSCEWSKEHGKKATRTDSYQGNMPTTVTELWSLTGEQKLKLVGGDTLSPLSSKIDKCTAAIKKVKAVIAQPAPVMPEPYDGPELSLVQSELDEISEKLRLHNEALKQQASVQRTESELERLELELEGISEEPVPQCVRARAGQEVAGIVSEMRETADWLSANGWDVTVSISGDLSGVIPAELSSSQDGQKIRDRIKVLEASLDCAIYGHTMSEDEFEESIVRQDELSKLLKTARSWDAYDDLAGRHTVARSEAALQLAELEQELQELRKEREDTVKGLKGPLESMANKKLEAAGAPPLVISIEGDARGSRLNVLSSDGVDIQAMAGSWRLVYGLCLLASIHALSDAECPVLLAECAEMNPKTLEAAVKALGEPEKGNIILEHWAHKGDVQIVS